MFLNRSAVHAKQIAGADKVRLQDKGQDPLALDVASLAPAGYYLALWVGFAFPVEEVNKLPPLWVEEYTRNGYMLFDPVMRWVYGEGGACRWSEIAQPDQRRIMSRAQAHGLEFGLVVSILDGGPGGQRSFGTFGRTDRELTDEEITRLVAYVRARHEALRPPQNVTDAEIEALRLIKSGQRLKQIAYQLGVTEGAVKQRLKNARIKLEAKTGAEAISKAASFGLI